MFFSQYVVYVFIIQDGVHGAEGWIPSLPFFLLAFSTLLIAAAGYVINDYYDIKIDLVNKPGRVVIGRIITRRQALFIHSFFNVLALFLGILLSWKVALFFAFCSFLLWLYSNYLKRTVLWGNICVSFLTAITILVILIYFNEANKVALVYAMFAFFISLIREIIKDMEDVKGDAVYGCRTLPIVLGFQKTKILLIALLIVFSLFLLFESYTAMSHVQFYIFNALLLPIGYLIFQLLKADKQQDYSFLSLFCKGFMVIGIISLGIV